MEHFIDGHILVLDDEDDHLLAQGPLTVHKQHLFARCGRRAVHTLVAGVKAGQRVTPIDGDFLNCRRSNLRVVTAEERQAELVRLRADRASQIKAAKEAASPFTRIPAELGSWGVMKTRCWERMFGRLQRLLKLKHPRLAELKALPGLLEALPGWTNEQCVSFLES